jgi:hypothetical protein
MALVLLRSEVPILSFDFFPSGNSFKTASEPNAKGIGCASHSICQIGVEGLEIDDVYLFI